MKLQSYDVLCSVTRRFLTRVLGYSETDARRAAAAYGLSNITLRRS